MQVLECKTTEAPTCQSVCLLAVYSDLLIGSHDHQVNMGRCMHAWQIVLAKISLAASTLVTLHNVMQLCSLMYVSNDVLPNELLIVLNNS